MSSFTIKRPPPTFSPNPANYKCRKVTATRRFPACGVDHAPRVDARSTGNPEVGEDGNIVPVENSKPSEMECETIKPKVSNDNVEALWQWVTVDNDVEVWVKTPDQPKVIDVPETITEAEPVTTSGFSKSLSHLHPRFRKYPPPKIRKGVTTRRTFPLCFGKRNDTSDSDKNLDNKCTVEQMQVFYPKRIDGEQTEVQIQDGNGFEKQLGGNDLEEMVYRKTPDQPKLIDVPETMTEAESVATSGFSKSVSHSHPRLRKYPPPKIRKGVTTRRTFPLCFGKQNGTSNSNKILDNKCSVDRMQVLDTKRIDGERREVRIPHGNGFEMQLGRNDLKDIVDEVHSSLQLIGCETGSNNIEGKSPENEGTQNDSILLQNLDNTESYLEKSVVLGVEPAISCKDTLFEDKESENHVLVGEKLNDLSIVPYVKIQEDVSRSKVREVLNLFQETVTKLSNEYKNEAKEKRKAFKQFSVNAAMLLKRQQKRVNTVKLLGPVPGVEIGDTFQFRAELVVIGLHHQFQGGIDYMEINGKNIATSIVKSGRYGDDAESSDGLIYSGQGGNPKIVYKPPEDQQLTGGNLALKNSMDDETPVRVILKTARRSQTTYTYDGLYKVTECKQERGDWGKLVYKFVLNRLAGQPKLNEVNVFVPKKSEVLELSSFAADDISQGKEVKPVRVVNTVDDEKLPPFHYITSVIYPEWYDSNRSVHHSCDCINGCLDFEECPCTVRYGGDIPFTSEGFIVRKKPLIYECGPSCKCPPSCQNRVSQNGFRYRLEIFKTEKMGWGVRSPDFIQSGGFICEYVGELLQEHEAEERVGNDEYLFDVGRNGGGFTIDAAKFGNVGRFINHSCSPNLYAQKILYDHMEKKMPHIMFFATEDVPPLVELTYDYNYKVDQVRDGNGNIKRKDCYCGSRVCRGRLY